MDGTDVQYTNFAPVEPSDPKLNRDCVYMDVANYEKMWGASTCTTYRGYACKVEKGKYTSFLALGMDPWCLSFELLSCLPEKEIQG